MVMEPWNIFRLVLLIAVHSDDDVPARPVKSSCERRRLTKVSTQPDSQNPWIRLRNVPDQALGPVTASVIYQNKFIVIATCFEDICQPAIKWSYIKFFVVEWDYDGVLHNFFCRLLASSIPYFPSGFEAPPGCLQLISSENRT